MDIVPPTSPNAVGVKAALMVQEAPAASETLQVLVWVNPVLGTIASAIAVVLRLVTVNEVVELVDPTPTLPNALDAGVIATGTTPVPVSEPTIGLPTPL
jgi:hypothetical protein